MWLVRNRHRSQTDNWVVTTQWATMRFEKEVDAANYFGTLPKDSKPKAYFIMDSGILVDLTEDYELLNWKPEPVIKRSVFDRVMDFIGL